MRAATESGRGWSPSPAGLLEKTHRLVVKAILGLPVGRAFALRLYNYGLKRTGGETYVVRTFFGGAVECDLRNLIQRTIFNFGVWEPDISELIRRRLRPGAMFLDIGANIGYDSLLASSCVGDDGHVISIEASPQIFSLLLRNLRRNNCSNVTAVNAAVTDRKTKVQLFAARANNIGATTTDGARGFRYLADVDAAPIESLVDPSLLKRIDLVKIDVEGEEWKILAHMLDTFDLYSENLEIVVELSECSDEEEWRSRDELLARFRALGFRCYAIHNSYDVEAYLSWPAIEPLEFTSYPRTQVDAFLTRTKL
jgi:FkbM family methyltransferase